MHRTFSLCFLLLLFALFAKAQVSIDKIIAHIGKEIILRSDLEKAYAEYSSQFAIQDNDIEDKCMVLEHLIYNKLLLHQADLDSIVITEQQVETALNWRMSQYLQYTGGDVKAIEKHFGKSIAEIKKDIREPVRDQLYMEEMQNKITESVSITPSEVKTFYNKMGVDSMRMIPATYEFGHILKTPEVSETELSAIKERLLGYKERALRSDNQDREFSTIARMYSDDIASAKNGGSLGFTERGTLYPEFEAVAFNLKSGEVSNVVKTRAGYHIILLHERRGETIRVSHILLRPKPSPEEQVKAIEYLDSVRNVIIEKKIDFSQAAFNFSDDPNKLSGGWVVNPYTLSTKFDKETLDQATFATIDKLIPDEYSSPIVYVNEDGVLSYRLLYLKSKVAPHKANLAEDYDEIKNDALEEKKNKAIERWLTNKVKITSIKIDEKYNDCDFVLRWQINK